jgi:hypothetical protein
MQTARRSPKRCSERRRSFMVGRCSFLAKCDPSSRRHEVHPTLSRLFGLFWPLPRSPSGGELAHVPGASGTAALPLDGRHGPAGSIILVWRPGSRTERGSHTARAGGKTFRRNTVQSRKEMGQHRRRPTQAARGSSPPSSTSSRRTARRMRRGACLDWNVGRAPLCRRRAPLCRRRAPLCRRRAPLCRRRARSAAVPRDQGLASMEQGKSTSHAGGPRRRPLRRKAWILDSAERCAKLALSHCHSHPSSARAAIVSIR